MNESEEKVLEQYSKNIFPLVSILIPSYNRPEYLKIALESAINQSYRNIEILIGDDSTNEDVKNMIEPYLEKYKNIKYFRNERNIGQFENDLKLIEKCSGDYINFLMDDDVFNSLKIEKMMNYYISDVNEDIALITSHRRFIDCEGKVLQDAGVTQKLFDKDTVIDGIEFGNFILKTTMNYIGEPTTVLFRKKDLVEQFGVFNGRKYGCAVDQATWFNLLSQGKIVYITETLSYYRLHDGQQQKSNKMKSLIALDYAHSVTTCRKNGFLIDDKEYIKVLNVCIEYINNYVNNSKCSNEEVEKYFNNLQTIKDSISNNGLLVNFNNQEPL